VSKRINSATALQQAADDGADPSLSAILRAEPLPTAAGGGQKPAAADTAAGTAAPIEPSDPAATAADEAAKRQVAEEALAARAAASRAEADAAQRRELERQKNELKVAQELEMAKKANDDRLRKQSQIAEEEEVRHLYLYCYLMLSALLRTALFKQSVSTLVQ
jgi:hypothetical protein